MKIIQKLKILENVFKEYEQATYNDVTRFSYFGIQILYKKKSLLNEFKLLPHLIDFCQFVIEKFRNFSQPIF